MPLEFFLDSTKYSLYIYCCNANIHDICQYLFLSLILENKVEILFTVCREACVLQKQEHLLTNSNKKIV